MMNREISNAIENSELVLVGIGEEFSPAAPEYAGPAELEPYVRSRFYAQLPENHEVIQAYNHLREQIGKRPHFVVTMNTDDLIYRSEFEDDLIVAPCGSMGKLQCGSHITDASGIRERVLETGAMKNAVCPECGEPLQFHTIKNGQYLESGYLPQWERYKKWLSGTLNKKLCILELGVGFAFPQVIRWPFEKTALYNKKAVFVRVNSHFPQVEAEIAERAVSIAENPVTVFQR